MLASTIAFATQRHSTAYHRSIIRGCLQHPLIYSGRDEPEAYMHNGVLVLR
jgi:hypothetical protein